MNEYEYWKNFSLGTELETSGIFIYNGLKQINDLYHYEESEDVFEILYNLSVGFERLMKILIILTENQENTDQEAFEKDLITHNLDTLQQRIERNHKLGLNDIQKEFLNLLTGFYKKQRYDRFNLNDSNNYTKDKDCLFDFLVRKLNINKIGTFRNTKQIKSFLVKIVSNISTKLYERIEFTANKLQICTNDLRKNGKAYRIFVYKDFNFKIQNTLKKELFITLMHSENSNFLKFIKSIQPIPFDVEDENEIINMLLSESNLENHFDELETFYEKLEDKKERLNMLEAIGKKGIEFL